MNRKILKYLFLLVLPSSALAQKTVTDKEFQQALATNQFYADSASQELLKFAKLSSYYLSTMMPERFSKISLTYNFDKGTYIPSQGATKINAGKLSTEGTVKLGSIKLFGSFSYAKTFEDSTRFSHQTRNNTSSPYYFGSPAYVHYERSVYSFQAMANKNFLNEKLSLSIGTDYKVGDHFSTNDPRGSIGEYQFNLNAALGYKLSPFVRLGFGYRKGYGQEKITIGYKNPRYYESSSFPMYYNHLVNGYGETKPILNDRRYNDDQQRNGLDIYFDINAGNFGSFYLFGNYIEENQRYFFANGSGFTDYSKYKLKRTDVNLLWNKKLSHGTIGTQAQYQSVDGADYNIDFGANNYKYLSSSLGAKVFLTTQSAKSIYNHFIKANYFDEERIDGIRANDVYFNHLMLMVGSSKRWIKENNGYIGIGFSAHHQFSLSDHFTVAPANEAYFTRYVIYHDYLFNTSSAAGGGVTAEYGFPLFKMMLSSIKINAFYTQKLNQKSLNRTIVTTPGKDRFSSNISLNLYF
ncbi:hypothetical protein FFJ24_015415 [Pedobacter sp. KBS0701]|uniref:DUF6850 family outer membrane beta-barrel protein n=1 Tax=Pedobacter sp. KBS0701 TaxID=2578106 RepID=UPI00110DC3CA|nr:DUF6850 family outer membrane beta-barrel protein [Pedobacter sp. KBS0701]QDW26126.1 hypothetical protein FFJ24_015415 [Pedobacter sp. KBS0701]